MKQSPGKSRFVTALLLTGFVLPLMTGTTYVVLEGEKEVGRYEDHDGIQDVKYVKQDKRQPAPAAGADEKTGKTFFRDPLENFGKKYLDFKITDPDLIRFLNRQPWMMKLREWDKQYGLEENLGRYRPFFVWAIAGLLGLAVFLRVLRLLRRLTVKKTKSDGQNPST